MLNGLLGKKLGMTQIFDESDSNSEMKAVTLVLFPKTLVVQKKTVAQDGYNAIKLGVDELTKNRAKKQNKAHKGQFKDSPVMRHLKEFKVQDVDKLEVGQPVDISIFKVGDLVDIAGISKGKGFAGVIKRHKFSGGPASHGHRFHRTGGSIGQRKFPGRVFKNRRMPGHMGNRRVTLQKLKIAQLDLKNNLLFIQGAVPGPTGSLVEVRKTIKK